MWKVDEGKISFCGCENLNNSRISELIEQANLIYSDMRTVDERAGNYLSLYGELPSDLKALKNSYVNSLGEIELKIKAIKKTCDSSRSINLSR